MYFHEAMHQLFGAPDGSRTAHRKTRPEGFSIKRLGADLFLIATVKGRPQKGVGGTWKPDLDILDLVAHDWEIVNHQQEPAAVTINLTIDSPSDPGALAEAVRRALKHAVECV